MELKNLINQIVSSPELHAKWLNALSMMENTGARKISASEHDQLVDEIVLKHAAEEARHAYYLKSQIKKTGFEGCKTYQINELLAPIESFQYLHALDASISRYLKKNLGYTGSKLKYAAYLLVTYAIEVRADALYPVYEEVLRAIESKISVRMIVVEEQGHLEEMIQQMDNFFGDWKLHGEFVLSLEQKLFQKWMTAIQKSIESKPAFA
ncbi:hypothetical protein [Ekhidna sp.]|uniref:hypothetical protein n=1 Tax=Ekhidna sp. TaxID=2608089 RepID=UPI00329685E7